MSLIPSRPPGRSTRLISDSMAGFSVERLMTQLEMTTSTESAGSGILLDQPLEEVDVSDAGFARIPLRQGEHLVGHVKAVRGAGLPDALGGQDHVDAAARPK